MRYIISVLLILTACSISMGQYTMSQKEPFSTFDMGAYLMDKGKYGAAIEQFDQYINDETKGIRAENAVYQKGLASLKLFHPPGDDLLTRFAEENDTHSKSSLAMLEVGNRYFNEENYSKANHYLTKVDDLRLPQREQNQLHFRLGYSLLAQQKFDSSAIYFNQVKREKSRYKAAASYYAGYLAYRNKNWDQALYDLEQASEDETYQTVVPPLIAGVYYLQSRYDEVISYTNNLRNKDSYTEIKDRNRLMLLAGLAHYELNNYDRALPYLEDFADSEAATLSLHYRIGFSRLKVGENKKAIKQFEKIAGANDTLSQYAAFNMGLLYVKEENYPFAINAFQKARDLDINKSITQDAAFFEGKINYINEDYSEAIEALKFYKKQYTNGRHIKEVNDLLSEAYLHTNNYNQALSFIEGLDDKSEKIKKAYQKATFYKATEFFNKSRFRESVNYFEKSLTYPKAHKLTLAAYFWKGEAYSIGKKYDSAINAYSAVLRKSEGAPNHPDYSPYHIKSRYGIGYAYFQQQSYDQALVHFNKYVSALENMNKDWNYDDALIRLADCYYANRTYQTALNTYQKAIDKNNPETAYAYYQKGKIQGIMGSTRAAFVSLNKVINEYPNARFHDDAIFEKGNITFNNGNYEDAIDVFSRLINNKPRSQYIPYALMKRAIAHSNLDQFEQSSENYKKILEDHINHSVANSALMGLQEVSGNLGNEEMFKEYLAKYKQANPEDEQVGQIEYESAKNHYFNQEYDKAISALKDYLDNTENPANQTEAKFYIAESYYRSDANKEALPFYKEVVRNPGNPYQHKAAERLARINYQSGDYNNAVEYFELLENTAQSKKDKVSAWQGLMLTFFNKARQKPSLYDSAKYYANNILDQGGSSFLDTRNKAMLTLGKIAYEKGDYETAMDHLVKTTNAAKDENGAEAQYIMAQIQYQQEKHKQSIQTLYDLNKNFSSYEYWLGKSFLLIAENYSALGEQFQAKATLESIVENSPVSEIVETAKNKLAELEDKEQEADSISQSVKESLEKDTMNLE